MLRHSNVYGPWNVDVGVHVARETTCALAILVAEGMHDCMHFGACMCLVMMECQHACIVHSMVSCVHAQRVITCNSHIDHARI